MRRHGEVARAQVAAVLGLEGARETPVGRRLVGEGIVVAGDQPLGQFADAVQVVVVGGVARGEQADAGVGHAAVAPELQEDGRHLARGQEEEHGLRLELAQAQHVGRVVERVQRHAQHRAHAPAARGDAGDEGAFGVHARGVVGHHGAHVA
ncbi:hypothetical protein D3C72_1679740 [compost metagenome]